MTDIEKIRKEVERLKSNLIHGACASQIAMETRCKEEAYNEVLAILDTLQEEPVSEEWIEELRTKLDSMSKEDFKKVFDKYAIDFNEEPVSEDLNSFAIKYAQDKPYPVTVCQAVKAGAKWKAEQFEKNRLKHCNSITNEQAELESVFIDQHLDKYNRMPTFLDAIEYGMRLQKEQIEEALLSEVLPCFMHGGEADEVVAKLDEVLNRKK